MSMLNVAKVHKITVNKIKYLPGVQVYARTITLSVKGTEPFQIHLSGKTAKSIAIDGADNEPEPLPEIDERGHLTSL